MTNQTILLIILALIGLYVVHKHMSARKRARVHAHSALTQALGGLPEPKCPTCG